MSSVPEPSSDPRARPRASKKGSWIPLPSTCSTRALIFRRRYDHDVPPDRIANPLATTVC